MFDTERLSSIKIVLFLYILVFALSGCLDEEDPEAGLVPASTPDANSAPLISGVPDSRAIVGTTYRFTPTATDADKDKLSFSIENKPSWADFSKNSGELSGQPTLGALGEHNNVLITVSDGQASASLPRFSVVVEEDTTPTPNARPQISGSAPTTIVVGSQYDFTPGASDADGDALVFSIQNAPPWTSFDNGTGRLSGQPGTADVGTYANIRISVSDGQDTASLSAFSITVEDNTPPPPTNSSPTISGTPQASVAINETYNFIPNATDTDGDTLTFSIQNAPSWASFNSGTGRLSGQPGAGDVGTYTNIRISVSDGQASASLPTFSITVEDNTSPPPTNASPTISGTPQDSIVVGQTYDFTPNAADADGDTLTFSIQNAPSWASFNSGTGRLSGQPGAGDVGTYNNIMISVSDGQESASLPTFSVTVVQAANLSITLSWTAPTENEDGTPLMDLAGYRIYWGTTPGVYPNSVTLNNPGLTTYVVENLSAGTYEFVATSFNDAGMESDYSAPVTKVAN